MYVYCVYPQKVQKQLPNCLKIADTSVVLNVFKGVICDISAYTVTVSSVAQQESDKYLSSQWNLTAQLEPVQDELRVKS